MTTVFENYRWDESSGSIKTLTQLSVWDCYQRRWLQSPPVVLRNTMLAANHPYRNFCIGQIRPDERNPITLNPFTPPGVSSRFALDMASNSRNHGRFTFTQGPIGRHYYGEDWKRIIYGSILHTSAKQLIYVTINYIVVDDERVNRQGVPEDDPVNRYHWNTGDSHGKVSASLAQLLRLFNLETGGENNPNNPVQFRASLHQQWVAKGTVAWSPQLDNSGYDLVLPLSCFKGKKPALGNYRGKLLIGTIHEAERRRIKLGWQFSCGFLGNFRARRDY